MNNMTELLMQEVGAQIYQVMENEATRGKIYVLEQLILSLSSKNSCKRLIDLY